MRKVVNFGILKASAMTMIITAKHLSNNAIKQIRRAEKAGIKILVTPSLFKALENQGFKMTSFMSMDESVKTVLSYPKSGIPSWVTSAIVTTTSADRDTVARASKKVIHLVFTELEEATTSEVEGVVTYNITDVLNKGVDGGRITMTHSSQLEEVLDIFETNNWQITEDAYTALATKYGVRTSEAIIAYQTSVKENLEQFVPEADAVVAKYRKKGVTA